MSLHSASSVFPPPADGAWQDLLGALFSRWFGDSAISPDASADVSGVPGHVFEALAAIRGPRRRQMLAALRERCATAAIAFAHPSWLAEIPSLGQAPPWCAGLRLRLIRDAVPFPPPFPWRLAADRPSTLLWVLPAECALRLVRRHGLRPLALAVLALGTSAPRRLGALAYALDSAGRTALTRRVRELTAPTDDGADPRARAWLAELDRLGQWAPELDPAAGLGLLDLALRATAEGSAALEDMVRLAFRLPQETGLGLLQSLRRTTRGDGLPDAAADENDLAADLEELVAEGAVARPVVAELRREVMA